MSEPEVGEDDIHPDLGPADDEWQRFQAAVNERNAWMSKSLTPIELQELHIWCYDKWVGFDEHGVQRCTLCKTLCNSNRLIAVDVPSQLLEHCPSEKHVKKARVASCFD